MTVSIFRRDNLNLDSVRVLEVNCIVAAGSGVFLRVENGDAAGFELLSEFIDVLLGSPMKGEVVQPDPTTVIDNILEPILHLHENNVGFIQSPTATLVPILKRLVAKTFQQPSPELDRFGKVRYIDFDVVEMACGVHGL